MSRIIKIRKALVILLLVLIIYLTGCSSNQDPSSSQQSSSESDSNTPIENTASNIITAEDFYKAIQERDESLSENERIKEYLNMAGLVDHQIFYRGGYKNHVVAWFDDGAKTGIVAVFEITGNEKKLIYLNTTGRIQSVKFNSLSSSIANHYVVEIISYGASSSFTSTKVSMLAINADDSLPADVREIWSHEIISTAWHPIASDEEEVLSTHNPYLIVPSYQLNYQDSSYPAIYVTETEEVVRLKNQKESYRNSKSVQKIFMWNQEEFKFVEKE